MSRRIGGVQAFVLLASLALLLAHAGAYSFLCDDAFISFRYARNLAHGHGLVFNPGFARVEGYTNFLWVLLLAALDRVGLPPETASRPLSFLATAALWALVVGWILRRRGTREGAWVAAAAGLTLACIRSVAVWSTSGLETRLFELLAFAGTLRLLLEIEDDAIPQHRLRPWSGLLFGLATLTRPDGALVGVLALAAAFLAAPKPRARVSRWMARTAGFAAPVAAQTLFRVLYYGAWVPNTYTAKVGGRLWWDMGLAYAGAFALEYGAFLWIPLLVLAGRRHARETTLHVPIVMAAVVLPHALYIIAIGGDHFEYRPFDLVFPFAAVLLAEGLSELASAASLAWASGAAAVLLFGLVWLPLRSHLEFPRERYRTGFPGMWVEDGAAERYLDPRGDPVLGWPLVRAWPEAHRALLDTISRAAVGVRQEEHALFLASVRPEGMLLRQAIEAGRIPADLHVALACVGAIPYESDLRTLDRLGLTDATVARMPSVASHRVIAHERRNTGPYEREAGVDLACLRAAHLLYRWDDPEIVFWVSRSVAHGGHPCAAEVGDGWLVGTLPLGTDAIRRRARALTFADLGDPNAFDAFVARVGDALAARHAGAPGDVDVTIGLAQVLLLQRRAISARGLFEEAASAAPDRLSAWVGLAGARAAGGDPAGAKAAVLRAADLARRRGASGELEDILPLLERLGIPQHPPAGR